MTALAAYLTAGLVAAGVHFVFGRHEPVPLLETAYELVVITLLWPVLVLFTAPGFFFEPRGSDDS